MGMVGDFILNELKSLNIVQKNNSSSLPIEDVIFNAIKTRKYRKFAASNELLDKIKKAIRYDVSNNEPINITFLQGCYKLWRLEEAPEVDWAEFFAVTYYVKWVKPILELYKPGVVFDFYVDDLIMERISNYTRQEIDSYRNSFQKLLNLIKSYCPSNIEFKITTVSSRFENEDIFWNTLDKAIENSRNDEIEINESLRRTLLLNYRPINNEILDEAQMLKIIRIHNIHSALSVRLKYREMVGKILVMPHHYSGCVDRLFLGSTKDSIVKYWVGIGALRVNHAQYVPTVLSPQQLKEVKFDVEELNIRIFNLTGLKNFKKIRILDT